MKRIIIIFLLGTLCFPGVGQKRVLRLAELPGFVTLACDFHVHTVFSDGEVWPMVRLDEAERAGLDAFAFTDHIEYNPHKEYIPIDLNAAWKVAHKEGQKRDIIVIHGAEITRKMPPGHFNALFIDDASKLTNPGFMKVMEEALAQGAFIQWNHPGWKGQRPDGIPKMDSIHQVLIDKKMIHGMEIYNFSEFYPLVLDWCLDYNLTMTGNSDIHGPVGSDFPEQASRHLPITLVFAQSRTEQGIKEALMEGRTLVWFGDTLAGKEELASTFFLKSIEVEKVHFIDEKYTYRYIRNKTDIPFSISVLPGGLGKQPVKLYLQANSEARLKLPKEAGENLEVIVSNVLIGKGKVLNIPFSSMPFRDI